jgi:hypothetical protein
VNRKDIIVRMLFLDSLMKIVQASLGASVCPSISISNQTPCAINLMLFKPNKTSKIELRCLKAQIWITNKVYGAIMKYNQCVSTDFDQW